MKPAFSDVINTKEYHENKIRDIDQGLIDIRNEKNPRLREEITKNLRNEKKFHILRLASIKEDSIKNIHHSYDRVCEHNPHLR